jgi:hypothetical protein
MFAVRQAAPLLARTNARITPIALKACAASISAAAPTHRIDGGITNLACGNDCKIRTLSNHSIRTMATLSASYDHILAEKRMPETSAKGGGVGLITLHRPKALNALCDALFEDLIHAVNAFEEDEDVGCVVITGSPKAFAAGADISEMSTQEFANVYKKVCSLYYWLRSTYFLRGNRHSDF